MLAEAMHEWLPGVLQAVKPFVSTKDLDKGGVWPTDLLSNLGEAKMAIVCVTPENIKEPWLLFEAGAMAKAVDGQARLCTYLLGMKPTDLSPPLSLFNATRADK